MQQCDNLIIHFPDHISTLFFFLKIYFYYFFIGKADIQRGETERKIFHPMIHSPSERNGPILCRSEARSLFRVSHVGTGSQSFGLSSTAFPRHGQGAGREAGLPGLEPAPIWDSGRARRGPSTTCATAPGPPLLLKLLECTSVCHEIFFYCITKRTQILRH